MSLSPHAATIPSMVVPASIDSAGEPENFKDIKTWHDTVQRVNIRRPKATAFRLGREAHQFYG